MKCRACGSDDVTQSKGKCNECRWVWEQEHKPKENKSKVEKMSSIFDFFDEEHFLLEEFKSWWMEQHKKDPVNYPLAVPMDNSGTWFDQYLTWKER